MFDLVIDFVVFKRFALFLLLSAITAFWTYRRLRKNLSPNPWPFIILNLLLFIVWALIVGIDSDEVDNLHSAWMTAQGLIPFKDFWQCRSPFLALVLSPAMRLLQPGVYVFDLSRIFCAAILIVIIWLGWEIAKASWKKDAKVSLYLLVISAALINAQFLWLRPDILMLLFLFFGLRLSLMIPGGRMWPVFCAGLSFAIAASFVPKQYFLYLLPLIIIFLCRDKRAFAKTSLYLSGFFIGCLPLSLYLIKENILKDFFFWVFIFNGQLIIFRIIIPVVFVILSISASVFMLRRYHKTKDMGLLILFIAFSLSTASSITGVAPVPSCGYYLSSWFIICAALFCGFDIKRIAAMTSSRIAASLLIGVLFMMLVSVNSFIVYDMARKGNSFKNNKAYILELQKYTGNDTCLNMMPMHPVFARDAARLYCYWQFYYTYYHMHYSECVKKDLVDARIADSIIRERPAVVLYQYIHGPLFELLSQKGLITRDDLKRLEDFCRDNYVLKSVGVSQYYIRRDRIDKVKNGS